ncbi:hypothetical protein CY35_08G076700 [Sphagnum magellanicum]|nr:hypothetical protein CY35_08G076700 [Sphagnum magellanicum]
MGSCRGFKDECKIPQLLLVCRLQQLRLVTYGCSFTSGRVIKYALLFCTFLSLFCSCLTSALAPAPAPAPAIPPFPVPVADLPGSWNTTVIGSSRFYYETKEVDAMQSLLAHWSNTATNSFSYNLPGWTSQPDLNYPCFEQADWQGVACYAFEGTYKGTTYFIVTVGYIELSSRGLQGGLPPAIGNLSNLVGLILVGNPNLGGPIPEELGSSAQLELLDLHDNAFNGSIPITLGYLQELGQLDFSGNELTGSIPPQLGNISGLETLELHNNCLNGTIPISSTNSYNLGFDNLTSLMTLTLQENLLSGGLPNLQSAYNLLVSNFSFNNLSGNVSIDSIFNSTSPLGILDLSFNSFTGAFPDVNIFSNSLQHLDLSNNLFDPTTFSQPWLSNFTHLKTLGLANISPQLLANVLHNGFIELGFLLDRLPSLQTLRLDQNNITGYLDLRNINISGPLNLINLTGNNMGPDFTSFLLYSNISNLVSSRLSIMLEDNPCCDNIWKNGMSGLTDAEIYYFCNSTPPPPKSKDPNTIVIEIIVPVTAVVFLIAMVVFFLYWSARKEKYSLLLQIQEEFAKQDVQPTLYAYNDIKIATQDFHPDRKIGQGSFGVVYKGILQDGSEIAVKHLLTNSQQSIDEFLNEVVLITNVKHKNLVKLKGCCLMGGGGVNKRLLVYEFVDNNNLAETIFENKGGHNVDWPMRKNICLGVARGLTYLHEDAQPRIIHRDIKAPNILLDKHFNAKIADFGLARLFPDTSTHISTFHIAGTMGYMAPEYASRGQLSEKVDVFSFGVLVLEIVSGRKNIEPNLNEDQAYLLEWVWKLYEEAKLLEIMDPKLNTHNHEKDIIHVINIGLLCVQSTASKRPSMARIVAMLQGDEMEIEVVIKENPLRTIDYESLLATINSSCMSENTLK